MKIKEVWGMMSEKLFVVNNIEISILSIISVVMILVLTAIFLEVAKRLVLRSSRAFPIDHGRRYSFFQIVKYVVWVVAIGLALESVGIRLTLFIAGSAALLVGLGLGIQQIFNDVVSGVILLFEGGVKVDDVMEIDGIVCRVQEIKLRTSKVITRDDIVVIIPNRKLINENVINWSHQKKYTRFHVATHVSLDADVDLVRRLLIEAAMEHRKVAKAKPYEPLVWFTEFGESALNFELLFYSSNNFRIEITKSDLRFTIIKKFREHGVRIPFPQRDLHWKDSSPVQIENIAKVSAT